MLLVKLYWYTTACRRRKCLHEIGCYNVPPPRVCVCVCVCARACLHVLVISDQKPTPAMNHFQFHMKWYTHTRWQVTLMCFVAVLVGRDLMVRAINTEWRNVWVPYVRVIVFKPSHMDYEWGYCMLRKIRNWTVNSSLSCYHHNEWITTSCNIWPRSNQVDHHSSLACRWGSLH